MSIFSKCLIAVIVGAITGILRYFLITKKKEDKECQTKKENQEDRQQGKAQKR